MKLFLLICGFLSAEFLFAVGMAPGAPGAPSNWSSSVKQGVGTAYAEYDRDLNYPADSKSAHTSKVWFTIARGVVSEVFYPRIDTPQTRQTELLITDGKTFLHSEASDTDHQVERIKGSLLYKITNRDKINRYQIVKEIWSILIWTC